MCRDIKKVGNHWFRLSNPLEGSIKNAPAKSPLSIIVKLPMSLLYDTGNLKSIQQRAASQYTKITLPVI